MRARLALASLLLGALSCGAVLACGPEAPPPNSPMKLQPDDAAAPTQGLPHARDKDAALSETTTVTAMDGGLPTTVQQTFPPPKPTVIKLAHGEGGLQDEELAQGDRALESQDYTSADAHYAKAEKIAPKDPAPKVGRARVKAAKAAPDFGFASASKNHDVMAAASDLRKIATDPLNASYGPAFAELGRAELLLGDATNAETHLARAAELLGSEPEVHSALGVAHLANGDAKAALASLSRAVELDSGSAPRHGNLGTVYFMLGQVKEAVGEYEIEVRLADAEPRAHSDLGTALLASNDVTRGIAELRRAVQIDPRRATFHSNLGYALQLSGKRDEAVAEYREALRLDPKLVSAWVNLATALARDPKTRPEARSALETAKKLDPADPRVKANLEELDALEKGQILH